MDKGRSHEKKENPSEKKNNGDEEEPKEATENVAWMFGEERGEETRGRFDLFGTSKTAPISSSSAANFFLHIGGPFGRGKADEEVGEKKRGHEGGEEGGKKQKSSEGGGKEETFKDIALVCKSRHVEVYKATSKDGVVAVKVLSKDCPEIVRKKLSNEYEIGKGLDLPCFRTPKEMTIYGGRQALKLEWVEGKTLKQQGKFNIEEFLQMSKKLVSAVDALHSKGIVHNNLTCDNIVLPHSLHSDIKIMDFGLSFIFDPISFYRPKTLATATAHADPSYTAPEKIKHQHNSIDFRSDLYSLGIIFYSMLTHTLPFITEKQDAAQLMQMHLSQPPRPLDQSTPLPISEMIMKLLHKSPEDRYQSAKGLLYDIDWMIAQHPTDPVLSSVVIAQQDFPYHFLVPQRLYGRDLEIAVMISTLEKVSAGALEVTFVSGETGSGKTALVSRFCDSAAAMNAFVIKGKFDPKQQGPYDAIIQSCVHFCDIMLKQPSEKQLFFKNKILKMVGEQGKVLTDAIHNLHLLIGKQPPVPECSGEAAKKRFHYFICKFIRAVCSGTHPTVMFIDDLQYADRDSLSLLATILEDVRRRLLFVAAYRDEMQPFATDFFNRLAETEVNVSNIKVDNLGAQNINDLISNLLNLSRVDCYRLSSLILKKTQGNSLCLIHFLRSLMHDSILFYSYRDKKWKWDIEQIVAKDAAEDISELITRTMMRLGPKALNALKVASCLKSPFSLQTLKEITDDADAISKAISKGFITPIFETDDVHYKFNHEVIQNAAYSLIPETDRNSFHFDIGRLLLKSSTDMDASRYNVVHHLNYGLDLCDPHEQWNIAGLNLEVGLKAIRSAAFQSAVKFLEKGVEILNDNHWNDRYDLSLGLYNALAETYLCLDEFDQMEEMTERVISHARDLIHKVDSYSLLIRSLFRRNKNEEAIEVASDILTQLGERSIPEYTEDSILSEVVTTQSLIEEKSNDDLISMHIIDNDSTIATMKILSDLVSSSIFHERDSSTLVVLRMMQVTLQNGLSKHACYAFAYCGVILCGELGDIVEGYRLCQIALSLLDRLEAVEHLPKVYFSVYCLMNHWCNHIHLSLSPLFHSFEIGLQLGAEEISWILCNHYCAYSFWSGKPLVKLETEIKKYHEKSKGILSTHRAVLNFLDNGSSNPAFLTGEDADEDSDDGDNTDSVGSWFHSFNSMIMAYFFHEYDVASKWLEECKSQLKVVAGAYHYALLSFYDGLISMALVHSDMSDTKWIKSVSNSINQLKEWSKYAPNNFHNKASLLEAEMLALSGDVTQAIELYNEAISLAKQNHFIHEEALACERAGIFCIRKNNDGKACGFMSQARRKYTEWGAKAKVQHLLELYPDYLGVKQAQETMSSVATGINLTLGDDFSMVSDLSMPSCFTARSRGSHLDES